jgi:hypothetical protein
VEIQDRRWLPGLEVSGGNLGVRSVSTRYIGKEEDRSSDSSNMEWKKEGMDKL